MMQYLGPYQQQISAGAANSTNALPWNQLQQFYPVYAMGGPQPPVVVPQPVTKSVPSEFQWLRTRVNEILWRAA